MSVMSLMGKKPFFSVVIPIYNKEPHVSRSIDSVLNQSFSDFELILICDPSTDQSNSEVNKFTDSRIRIYHRDQPGPGGYAARNLGIERAGAEWIAFLDADDEWMPDHLEKLEELSKSSDVSVMSAGWIVKDGNTAKDAFSSKQTANRLISYKEFLYLDLNSQSPIWTSVACIKKSVLLKAGMFPEGKITMGGDVDTWLRVICSAGSLAWSNHIGGVYHRDSINMVTRNSVIYPSLHVETAQLLSTKTSDLIIRQFLKKRSNKYVVYAWNNNVRVCPHRNFIFNDFYFFEVNMLKGAAYSLFSRVPVLFLVPLHRAISICLKMFRGLSNRS